MDHLTNLYRAKYQDLLEQYNFLQEKLKRLLEDVSFDELVNSPESIHDRLGVPENATAAEIKAAFRKLAKEYHPDQNLNNQAEAAEKFNKIREAYDTLTNSDKLREYQQRRSARSQSSRTASTQNTSSSTTGQPESGGSARNPHADYNAQARRRAEAYQAGAEAREARGQTRTSPNPSATETPKTSPKTTSPTFDAIKAQFKFQTPVKNYGSELLKTGKEAAKGLFTRPGLAGLAGAVATDYALEKAADVTGVEALKHDLTKTTASWGVGAGVEAATAQALRQGIGSLATRAALGTVAGSAAAGAAVGAAAYSGYKLGEYIGDKTGFHDWLGKKIGGEPVNEKPIGVAGGDPTKNAQFEVEKEEEKKRKEDESKMSEEEQLKASLARSEERLKEIQGKMKPATASGPAAVVEQILIQRHDRKILNEFVQGAVASAVRSAVRSATEQGVRAAGEQAIRGVSRGVGRAAIETAGEQAAKDVATGSLSGAAKAVDSMIAKTSLETINAVTKEAIEKAVAEALSKNLTGDEMVTHILSKVKTDFPEIIQAAIDASVKASDKALAPVGKKTPLPKEVEIAPAPKTEPRPTEIEPVTKPKPSELPVPRPSELPVPRPKPSELPVPRPDVPEPKPVEPEPKPVEPEPKPVEPEPEPKKPTEPEPKPGKDKPKPRRKLTDFIKIGFAGLGGLGGPNTETSLSAYQERSAAAPVDVGLVGTRLGNYSTLFRKA